ncbi:MAG: hypothetical protein MMC23_008762 [Stictis urceolatum]|nr:hypothetical protein [Stictis urceolata]
MPSINLRSFLDEASVSTFLEDAHKPEVRTIFDQVIHPIHELVKRINTTVNANSSQAMWNAHFEDPWVQAGKYSLGWVYYAVIILAAAIFIRIYHMWTDKIRRALYKEETGKASWTSSPDTDYEMHTMGMSGMGTSNSVSQLFPREVPRYEPPDTDSSLSIPIVNKTIALVRWLFYRPIPVIRIRKTVISFPSAASFFFILTAFAFTLLYSFVPQPLFYQSIRYGSPPLAIRAGMLAVAMIPWIVAMSMKANLVSLVTGIGHERLNVLHRWAGYICMALSIVHTVPFYITPVWDHGALGAFKNLFRGQPYVYGTGVAALVPLVFLTVHSLPIIRNKMYELFVALHIPASLVFVGMMFWHCNNYLNSWHFLFATVAIWLLSLIVRLFYLNWTNFRRLSWMCGEEAAITLLPENAVKVTIPTQVRWKPGQFVYLRMPGISFFENHPFTIASLCSEDFPSDYGEQYRDMVVVFRPFGGFTRKVVDTAVKNGPYQTYRAFIDGPYGGMTRELASFDTVVLVAGGSGITAIVSQLLLLIKKMRDGTAITKQVHVIWALKRPETAEWFKEELRICRQFAPPESVHCQFFITAAKRHEAKPSISITGAPHRHSQQLHERVNDAFQGIASKRNSAIIRDEAGGDAEREKELHKENEDSISALPQAYLTPQKSAYNTDPKPPSTTSPPIPQSHFQRTGGDAPPQYFPPPPTKAGTKPPRRAPPPSKLEIPTHQTAQSFDFGFPSTPTHLQKNLMRFAFLPTAAAGGKKGWHTEYGRPDIPYMLRGLEREFGRRAAVFVCGPPTMREDVQREVARMQGRVVRGERDEVFLHTENYAI